MHPQNDCGFSATRVAGNIIDAFFDDEKYLAPRIRAQLEIMVVGSFKLQCDTPRTERVAGKPPHSLHQFTEAILAGIDRPHNVTHGINKFTRG